MKTFNQQTASEKLLEKGFKLISKYTGWDKKVKIQCIKCNDISNKLFHNIKYCGKSCASSVRRIKSIKKHGALSDHPFLVKEYLKNNDLKPEEVPCNYSALLNWKCSKCGNEWKSSIHERLSPKNKLRKYTVCRGKCLQEASKEENIRKSLEKFGSFAENYPDLLKEFDFKKNKIDPHKTTRFSHQKVHWKCKAGHNWISTIANRTGGKNNCPKCKNFKTSKAEIRIYTEFKNLFGKVNWSDRSFKKEIDIFLPQYKIAIEIDGYRHIDIEDTDKKKNEFFNELGIKVIRLRDYKLKNKISKNDFIVDTADIKLKDIKNLLKQIMLLKKIEQSEKEKLRKYLKTEKFLNENEYRNLIEFLPGVPFERSIVKLYPKVAKQWNYKLNHPLKPEFFTRGSHFKAFWNCPKCKKPYQTKILKKTQRPNSTCRECAYKIIAEKNKLRRII